MDLPRIEHKNKSALAEALRQEIQRRKLLIALKEAKGCWKKEGHPELQNGSEAFIERLRAENDERRLHKGKSYTRNR